MNDRERFFYQLLQDSGIQPDMRVLDIGCGSGDLTHLVDEMLDHDVSIVGVDIAQPTLDMAEERKTDEQDIRFIQGDINQLPEDIGTFDCIIGRRVLMYVEDASESIRALKKHLKQGGKMIIQESDRMSDDLNGPNLDFHTKIQSYVWQTVEAEKGNPQIGRQLYQLFKDNGFQIEDIKSELILQTSETGSDLGWVAEMMTDRFKKYGVVGEDWDIETVKQTLDQELEAAQVPFIRDCAFGICAVNN